MLYVDGSLCWSTVLAPGNGAHVPEALYKDYAIRPQCNAAKTQEPQPSPSLLTLFSWMFQLKSSILFSLALSIAQIQISFYLAASEI